MSSHKIPSPNHTPYRILIDRSSRRCTEEFGRTARGHDLGPLGAPKKRATTRPGAHEKRTTRSTARSSRRQPAISPGALIPTLCKEKDAAPSESGGPSSDPRVIRNGLMQKSIWSTNEPRRHLKYRAGTHKYMFAFLPAQNASSGSNPRS